MSEKDNDFGHRCIRTPHHQPPQSPVSGQRPTRHKNLDDNQHAQTQQQKDRALGCGPQGAAPEVETCCYVCTAVPFHHLMNSGVLLDSILSFQSQINHRVLLFSLKNISRLRPSLPDFVAETLILNHLPSGPSPVRGSQQSPGQAPVCAKLCKSCQSPHTHQVLAALHPYPILPLPLGDL